MTGRISRIQMFIEMARIASKRATCFRLNVGAIVTHQNSPVSVGWNGAKSKDPHCQGNSCPGIVPGNCNTIHAEYNALHKASLILPPGARVDLYCTHSPCLECAEMIIEHKHLDVARIFFEIPYRNTQHLGMFQGNTELYEVTPAGYLLDYFTREVLELV